MLTTMQSLKRMSCKAGLRHNVPVSLFPLGPWAGHAVLSRSSVLLLQTLMRLMGRTSSRGLQC